MMSILDMLNGCDVYDMMRFYSLDAHKNYQAYYTQATDACEFSPSADSQHSHLLLLSVNPTEGERGPFQLVAVHSLAHIRSMLRCDLRSWHSVVSSKRSGERGCIEQHAGFAGERRRVHSKPCGRGGCGSRLDQRSDAAEEESGGDRELSGRHADSLHAGAGRRGESHTPKANHSELLSLLHANAHSLQWLLLHAQDPRFATPLRAKLALVRLRLSLSRRPTRSGCCS